MATTYQGTRATPRLDLGEAFEEYQAEAGTFVAEDVLAPFESPKRDAVFAVRPRASSIQNVDAKRAARGTFNRIDTRAKDKSFACKTNGLEGVIDDEERELYVSDFDADLATTTDVGNAVRIAKEVRVAAKIFDPVTWTGSSLYLDVSGSAPWATPTSDVISHVISAKETVRQNTGARANALILGPSQLANLRTNQVIKAQFPGANLITLAMIEAALMGIFGLETLICGKAIYDSAAEGATKAVPADVWSGNYAMVAVVAKAGDRLTKPCIGRTIKWSKFDRAMAVQMYREEGSMGDVVRVMESTDEIIIAPEFGFLLKIKA